VRSRWLSWRPRDEIIENFPDPKLTKLTKMSSVSFVGSTSAEFPIIRGFRDASNDTSNETSGKCGGQPLNESPSPEPTRLVESNFWGVHGDQYGWRLNAVCELISTQDYPVGAIPWLETAAPYLYDRLTRILPDKISRAWKTKVPFSEFDGLCSELEETHARALALFRSTRRADSDGV
jgi:hypothetical protein